MIDTYRIRHFSGPCLNAPFVTTHLVWSNRGRVQMASGERIRITLYGHGADFAQDVTGSNIHEWITKRGTTQDYPGAPIRFGQRVAKGFVTIDVRATASHGLGNRTINVKWPTGTEQLNLKILSSCADFTGTLRHAQTGSGSTAPPSGFIPPPSGGTRTSFPNLLPTVLPNSALARPLSQQVIPTTRGGMRQMPSFFAGGLFDNVVTAVPVPNLTWGVSGVNIELANTPFDAQLLDITDANNHRVLDTFHLPNGFPEDTPLVVKTNYPGRPTSIRVVKNPRFEVDHDGDDRTDPAVQTNVGCFTEPGSIQGLDPMRMLLIVDSVDRIDEDGRENDNELPF